MDPNIENLATENGVLSFRLTGVNYSLANAIRRTILADIPTVVFETFPYENCKAVIKTNTTRLSNEVLKQRLSCIPIHIVDHSIPLDAFVVEINKKNDTETTQYVTTADFQIKNKETNKYLSEDERETIFPRNSQTNQYIDFVRLRPKISDSILGEELKMTCSLSIKTAKDSSMFNVVSACSYGNTPDPEQLERGWRLKESELNKQSAVLDMDFEHKNWLTLEAHRLYIINSFDFIIESIGIFTNENIIKIACSVLHNKLDVLNRLIEDSNLQIKSSSTNMDNCYDIILPNEDYTLGKVLEYILHEKYFQGVETLNFCTFKKAHPHDTFCILRLGFKDPIEKFVIGTYLKDAIEQTTTIFTTINNSFTT
jgi:DNA-directed RNA polymerase alpha subunit